MKMQQTANRVGSMEWTSAPFSIWCTAGRIIWWSEAANKRDSDIEVEGRMSGVMAPWLGHHRAPQACRWLHIAPPSALHGATTLHCSNVPLC